VSTPRHCAAYPCTVNAPSPRRGAGGTLKCFPRDYTGLLHDVGPAGAAILVVVSPVRPSPSLQRHAAHCNGTPDAVGAHGDGTSPYLPLCFVRMPVDGTLEPAHGRRPDSQPLRHHPQSRSCSGTGCATTPRLNKIHQDGRQLCGTARHASTRRRIVWHTCKLLPPWLIKGGAVPQPQGTRATTESNHTHASRLRHDISIRLNQYLWDLEARPPLPPCL
jgi:hypothetical protein